MFPQYFTLCSFKIFVSIVFLQHTDLPTSLISSDFSAKIIYEFHISSQPPTCPAKPNILTLPS